jgi:hypothetical protein
MMVAFYVFKTVSFVCRCVLRAFRKRRHQIPESKPAEDYKEGQSFV